jgi:phage terminase large subunit-like protein
MTRRKQPAILRPTLGPLVVDWVEEMLVHGPGDIQGSRIVLDEELRRLIWRAYEVHPAGHAAEGRRVYRRVIFSRPKGRAKSELAGMLACAELVGPTHFDGWDAHGFPVGRPVTSPVIRLFATEADQASHTFDNVLYMLTEGSVFDEYPGIDAGLSRITDAAGGSIVSTTSAASSKDGGKDTFSVFDETHLWTTARLKSLHAVVTRNLVKRRIADGWALETSTMYAPGEGSVAEETHKSAADQPAVLFDHRQAPLDLDIADDDQLREALTYVYGDAAGWTNIDGIIADEFRNPSKRESECRRYWLNQPWSAEEKFILPADWDACADSTTIPDRARVVLGFDGSFTGDSTGVVACTIGDDPLLEVVGCWERPEGRPGIGWKVSRIDVMETIRQAAKRWRVVEACADPYGWAQSLEELADEGIPVQAFPQSGARMIPATKRLYDQVMNGTIRHSGDERLRRHMLNATLRTDSRGSRLSKESKESPNKIDLAVCCVMALERAAQVTEATPTVWSLSEVLDKMHAEGRNLPGAANAAPEPATPVHPQFIPLSEMTYPS